MICIILIQSPGIPRFYSICPNCSRFESRCQSYDRANAASIWLGLCTHMLPIEITGAEYGDMPSIGNIEGGGNPRNKLNIARHLSMYLT